MCMLTIGNVGDERVEEEHPCHWVCERFLELVHFEVLVADTLLVLSDALETEDLVLLGQPSRIELVVGHEQEEDDAHADCEQACPEL